MMKLLALGAGFALALAASAQAPAQAPQAQSGTDVDWAKLLAEVPAGEFDPLTIPMTDGIVFYGTWEDAMAEKERTGKPVLLHFGSPRIPSEQKVCVPGTW
jgi:hypothetical protein